MKLTIISGVAGPSVYLNDSRIAGEKPWGGGHVVQEWTIDPEDIERALMTPDERHDAPREAAKMCEGTDG